MKLSKIKPKEAVYAVVRDVPTRKYFKKFHETAEEAEKEAMRLSLKEKDTFIVVATVGSVIYDRP